MAFPLNSLGLRIVSALVLAPPVLLAVWYGTPYFEGLALLAALVMAWEWGRLLSNGAFGAPGIALAVSCLAALVLLPFLPVLALAAGVIGAVLSSLLAEPKARSWGALGVFYIVLPMAALLFLRAEPEGRSLMLWLFLIVWATDIGAYAAGRLIGGPLLAPAISPKKTWAGLLGGMAAAGLTSILGCQAFELTDRVLMPGLLGALLAVIAQGGDLFESQMKRHFGVKDSSNLIPGHGGLLDRVDGLLAAGFALGLLHMAGLEKSWM